jgi:hypothetical protein
MGRILSVAILCVLGRRACDRPEEKGAAASQSHLGQDSKGANWQRWRKPAANGGSKMKAKSGWAAAGICAPMRPAGRMPKNRQARADVAGALQPHQAKRKVEQPKGFRPRAPTS